MNIIKTIFKKELYDYFNSPIAYIYILIFLIVSHIYFFKNLFIYNQASMLSLFNFSPYFFFFLISAISMRVWSEEKKSGTLDFLFTFPLKDYQLVLGKFFAALLFISVILLSTLPFVAVVMYLGNPDILPIITGYFGLILLAAANLSLGFFLSSLTQNQIISFLLTALLSVFFFFINSPIILYTFPSFFTPILNYLSFEFHFYYFANGIISLQSTLFFISFIFFFLLLNIYKFNVRVFKK